MRLLPQYPPVTDDLVARLKVGLKQAPRACFEKLRDALLILSFLQSLYDPSMFLHHSSAGITLLLVYVDNIIITGIDTVMIRDLQCSLRQSFHMKDLGLLSYFLGPEVHHSEK